MKTAKYDILLLLNEKFLNELSGVLFYNNFLTFNGKKDFAQGVDALPAETLSKIPATLNSFLEIRYRCKLLHEPYIDFKTGNIVGIKANLRVYLWMLDGLELKFDASLYLETPLKLNKHKKSINVQLANSDIKSFKIKYNYSATQDIVLQLDQLFEDALHAYFNDHRNPLLIPIPTFDPYLPMSAKTNADKIPIDIKAIKTVDDQTMVIAANLFGYPGGDESLITNFARNCNLGVAISETAMLKVYNFFWARTTWDKTYQKSDTFHIDMVDKIVGTLVEIIGFINEAVIRLGTAGFVQQETDYISTDFFYTLDLNFKTKPTFDLLSGNRVAIYNLGVGISIRLRAEVLYTVTTSVDTSGFVPDECTPWDDDVQISKETKKIEVMDLTVSLNKLMLNYCIGKIIINEDEKNLQAEIVDFDLDLTSIVGTNCLYWKIPSWIREKIEKSMKKKIIDSVPPIVLSPSIRDIEIPGVDWKATVEGRKLTITNHEAIVGAHVHFKELQNGLAPVPKYIGNTNNMEVHRAGCDSILDTYETHQVGFYILQTALKKNFDGCKKCLPGFHKR